MSEDHNAHNRALLIYQYNRLDFLIQRHNPSNGSTGSKYGPRECVSGQVSDDYIGNIILDLLVNNWQEPLLNHEKMDYLEEIGARDFLDFHQNSIVIDVDLLPSGSIEMLAMHCSPGNEVGLTSQIIVGGVAPYNIGNALRLVCEGAWAHQIARL